MAQSKDENLHAMRHSLAHIMASAIQQLWPEAKFGVGPVIENGFYYDIDIARPINPDDLEAISDQMHKIIAQDLPFERIELPIAEAIVQFKKSRQTYKVSLLEDLKKHGTTLAKEIDREQLGVAASDAKITTVSIYKHGDFEDLCRGPHLKSTGKVGKFKLTKVAGVYWRGDEKNPQLQRIYGVAFDNQNELDKYFDMLAEAERRDHRKLGKELDLFTFSDLVGAGLPLYTPRGTIIIDQLKQALDDVSREHSMQKVSIPHLAKLDLYKISGHADKFEEELFRVKSHYNQEFVLKPVNCPHHTQIYAAQPRSYRDLPLRYVEQTMQYRDEKPGQIGGLSRTRGFTVDDGHVFCMVDQIKDEAAIIIQIIKSFYQQLGLWGDHWVSLSVRDALDHSRYIGEPSDWDQAEATLAEVSKTFKLDAKRMEGEAAIYGPKLDFMFKDALGRETQLATIQLDFAMPKRFELTYTDSDGSAKTPVMIHRAILGSFERFVMLLIEHYAGAFPIWLAPEQVRLIALNDTKEVTEYVELLRQELSQLDVRVGTDLSQESVGKKVRNAELMKVPYSVVIGPDELKRQRLKPRARNGLEEFGSGVEVDVFIGHLKAAIENRS
ncbi:MAG TPA: threonine--tRNA ligase [Candidatus Saccharimonadales bacterium]|nr:threonine--tRNA ligase [Candidatus Saccharimonadales bacterium]